MVKSQNVLQSLFSGSGMMRHNNYTLNYNSITNFRLHLRYKLPKRQDCRFREIDSNLSELVGDMS